jgi:hypothetical protein
MSRIPLSMQLDLSSTDEAAWPRLIAISASELAEQSRAFATAAPLPVLALRPSVSVVSFDVRTKTKEKTQYATSLGLSVTRLGAPLTSLIGPTLHADMRLGRRGLLASELRTQWGQLTIADANVSWRFISGAASGGVAFLRSPIEADFLLGVRVGQLMLSGEAKSNEAIGRKLFGPSGGPFVSLRLRKALLGDLLVGSDLEAGYSVWPVRGTYDEGAHLVSVDGVWTGFGLSIGWVF